ILPTTVMPGLRGGSTSPTTGSRDFPDVRGSPLSTDSATTHTIARARQEEEVRFARDSPLEEAVLSELVSEAKFPASWENTGNFAPAGHPRRIIGPECSSD